MIQQRFDADCAAACLAMLLGVTYEQVAQHCAGNQLVRYGVPDFKLIDIARLFDRELVAVDSTLIDWTRPAILTVPSYNTQPGAGSNGMHAVFWDGARCHDPNEGRPGKRTYTNQAARRQALDGMQLAAS